MLDSDFAGAAHAQRRALLAHSGEARLCVRRIFFSRGLGVFLPETVSAESAIKRQEPRT
jgi:hypothetical protein